MQVRPEQIDRLGDLAAFVLRAKVDSPRLAPGEEEGVEAEIDYLRGSVRLSRSVPLSTFRSFLGRYFDLSLEAPEEVGTQYA